MDLSSFDTAKSADTGAKMQLRNPADESILLDGVFITVAGRDSDRFQKAERAQTDFRLEQSRVSGRPAKLSSAGIEADRIKILVACTLGWEGIELDGAALEFSADNAEKLYKRLPWVKEQVDRFIADRANFLKA